MKKKILCIILSSLIALSTACGSKEATETTASAEEQTVSVARNDWYGAIQRMDKLDKDAKAVVDVLENNNYDIVMGNPQDYWSDGYYSFTFAPLASNYINYTLYLNESDEWATVITNTQTKVLATKTDAQTISVLKNDENDYTISWEGYDTFEPINKQKYVYVTLDCIYDASHNWAQLIESSNIYGSARYEEDFVEYAEIDANHYAMQCQTGRLFAEYDDEGNLVKMYYSKLADSPRERGTAETSLEDLANELNEDKETTDETTDAKVNEASEDTEEVEEKEITTTQDGIIYAADGITAYDTNPNVYNSEDDSMFSRINELGYDWVMEEATVEEYVIYENETLLFRVKNKLSGDYEGFIISNTVNEPVLNETDGKYYDPVSGLETTMEEYNERIQKITEQIAVMNDIIAGEKKDAEIFALGSRILIGDDEVKFDENSVGEEASVYNSVNSDTSYVSIEDAESESGFSYVTSEDAEKLKEDASLEVTKYNPVIEYFITIDESEVKLTEVTKDTDFSIFTAENNGEDLDSFIASVAKGTVSLAFYDENGVIYVENPDADTEGQELELGSAFLSRLADM